jgi:hypothetical protein
VHGLLRLDDLLHARAALGCEEMQGQRHDGHEAFRQLWRSIWKELLHESLDDRTENLIGVDLVVDSQGASRESNAALISYSNAVYLSTNASMASLAVMGFSGLYHLPL